MSIPRIFTAFTRKEIQKFFQTAKRAVKEPELTILVAPGRQAAGRILIVIPRAVGNAPIRNHLRRQLKSIYFEQKLYEYGVDCAIITRPGAAKLTFARLKELIFKAFADVPKRESR